MELVHISVAFEEFCEGFSSLSFPIPNILPAFTRFSLACLSYIGLYFSATAIL